MDDNYLSQLVECPVCLKVPRDLPIPSCEAGHIVCQNCRKSLKKCPKCRRKLSDRHTNTVAGNLIEKVAHRCKFEDFGCEVIGLLKEILKHERECAERTVICPVDSCGKIVQVKDFFYHAHEHEEPKFEPILWLVCRTYLQSSDQTDKSFSLSDKSLLKMMNCEGLTIYVCCKYYAAQNSFVIFSFGYRTEPFNNTHRVTMKIWKDNFGVKSELNFKTTILSIDEIPKDYEAAVKLNQCLTLSFDTLKNFSSTSSDPRNFSRGFCWSEPKLIPIPIVSA